MSNVDTFLITTTILEKGLRMVRRALWRSDTQGCVLVGEPAGAEGLSTCSYDIQSRLYHFQFVIYNLLYYFMALTNITITNHCLVSVI